MKSILMMTTNDAKQFAISTLPKSDEEQKIIKTHHESLMLHYKVAAGQAVNRMSQIALQIKLLNEENDQMSSLYKELYDRHATQRKQWEELSGNESK